MLFISLVIPWSLTAQQWVEKSYDYTVHSDSVYGTATSFMSTTDTLTLDVYVPECNSIFEDARRPLLMWIHGGAFLGGHKNEAGIEDLCIQFARRGYVTASINYRKGFVSDDQEWNCNYPEYSCVFAHEAAEWDRAYYRAVQDAKGAVRWLVNHRDDYLIDTDNIFVAGESAGAFIALGTALLDSESERPESTYALPDAPIPHDSTHDCIYNENHIFDGEGIPRPDLGGFEGTIEPTEIDYTIKGVGNMYGGMLSDLLEYHNPDNPQPAIYSFHQPCDLVVPIDSGNVYAGLSWCMTNGYGCYAIANTTKVYGSSTIDTWNSENDYGYPMLSEFGAIEFPYSFVFGEGSCLDQALNSDCHYYDNADLRENNLAAFFAPFVTTFPECLPDEVTGVSDSARNELLLFPNPVKSILTVDAQKSGLYSFEVLDVWGRVVIPAGSPTETPIRIDVADLPSGMYFVRASIGSGAEASSIQRFIVD